WIVGVQEVFVEVDPEIAFLPAQPVYIQSHHHALYNAQAEPNIVPYLVLSKNPKDSTEQRVMRLESSFGGCRIRVVRTFEAREEECRHDGLSVGIREGVICDLWEEIRSPLGFQ